MKYITLILTFFISTNYSFSQDEKIKEILSKNAHPISIENNSLKGEGAEWLFDQLENTQFVLLGEDHGIAEVPIFVNAVYNDLYGKGFNHFVTEVSPGILPKLEDMASNGKLDEFGALVKKYPLTIPFYNWQEEAQMIIDIYSKNEHKENAIWALDQEFIGSWRYHLQQMGLDAPNQEAKVLAQSYHDKAVELWDKAVKTGDFSSNLMFRISGEEIIKLKEAFKSQPETIELIDRMVESKDIYLKMSSNPYQSNVNRIELMKKNFYHHFNLAKNKNIIPKAIFKFGSTHMFRGASALNIFDIGNMASEIANSNGLNSFHILIMGVDGTSNKYIVLNAPENKQAPYAGKDEMKSFALDPIFDLETNGSWQLIDLEQLKNDAWMRKVKLDKGMEKTIYAFDALLLIPDVSAAKNF